MGGFVVYFSFWVVVFWGLCFLVDLLGLFAVVVFFFFFFRAFIHLRFSSTLFWDNTSPIRNVCLGCGLIVCCFIVRIRCHETRTWLYGW